jgi:hypothetical protein
MERYDYLRAIKEDVLNYINENNIVVTSENRDEVEQDLNDTLFTYDSVTGNASGSYTFNTWTAEEYLCHNWELLGGSVNRVRVRYELFRERCRSVRRYNTLLSVRASNF